MYIALFFIFAPETLSFLSLFLFFYSSFCLPLFFSLGRSPKFEKRRWEARNESMKFLCSLIKRCRNLHRVLPRISLYGSIFSASHQWSLSNRLRNALCAGVRKIYRDVSVELELIWLIRSVASGRRCIRGCKLTGDEVIRFDRSILCRSVLRLTSFNLMHRNWNHLAYIRHARISTLAWKLVRARLFFFVPLFFFFFFHHLRFRSLLWLHSGITSKSVFIYSFSLLAKANRRLFFFFFFFLLIRYISTEKRI